MSEPRPFSDRPFKGSASRLLKSPCVRSAAILAAVVFAVIMAYWPALGGSLIWDDEAHLTAQSLRSWRGLWRIWSELGATQQYYPLLHSAFWLEHKLWGDAVLGYHLVNLVQHLIAAGLFTLLLRKLAVPGATLAGIVFALHPVHVESVAWITEQKNTLSLILYLGAACMYLRFDVSRRSRDYGAAFCLFVLALLTKTVTATLPAALLVVFWWQRGHLSWRNDMRPLLPWFLIGIVAGLFTAWVEHHLIGAKGAEYELSLMQRGLLAGRIVWFYLMKLAWPHELIFIYPRWTIDVEVVWQWLPGLGAVALTFALWRMRPSWRAPLAAWLIFVGSLFPVLGFINVYPFRYSFVADHFQYLASLAPIALGSAGFVIAVRNWRPLARAALPAVLVVVLTARTIRETPKYRDSETLYRTTLSQNPECWMAHNNLGLILLSRGESEAGRRHFAAAVDLNDSDFDSRNNLGLVLTQLGDAENAVPHLRRAIELKPDAFRAYNNLGIALAACGRADEAVAAFQHALSLDPGSASLRANLAKALRLAAQKAENKVESGL
jgi:protein O-mannosyl-transferase